MAEKTIDLSKTVYELWKEDPGIAEILSELGFTDITKPGMLQTAGRFMTIPKGAALKHIEIRQIKDYFEKRGYEVTEGETQA